VNAGLIQGIDEDIGLNSMVGEIHGATDNNFLQVEDKIKLAVKEEKAAEERAVLAEEQMRTASNSQQRKKAKRKLAKAQ
jgi:hypothetical protein